MSLALAVASFVVFVVSAIWAAFLAYKVKDASAAATTALRSVVAAQRAEAQTANVPRSPEGGLEDAAVRSTRL